MNRKLLITDIFALAIGIVLLCVVQLMMQFNPALLTNRIMLISFAVALVTFGVCIMTVSYRNNTESINAGNFVLHIVIAIVFYAFYSIPSFGFAEFYGVGTSVCVAVLGTFCSRYAFTFSKYAKANNITGKLKVSENAEVSLFQRNIHYELYEILNIIGYIALIISTIALIYNTFNPCFSIAIF